MLFIDSYEYDVSGFQLNFTEVTYNNLTNKNLQNQRNILLDRQTAASPALRSHVLPEDIEKKGTPPPKSQSPAPAKPVKKKKKKKNSITANLGGTKYEVSKCRPSEPILLVISLAESNDFMC